MRVVQYTCSHFSLVPNYYVYLQFSPGTLPLAFLHACWCSKEKSAASPLKTRLFGFAPHNLVIANFVYIH